MPWAGGGLVGGGGGVGGGVGGPLIFPLCLYDITDMHEPGQAPAGSEAPPSACPSGRPASWRAQGSQ